MSYKYDCYSCSVDLFGVCDEHADNYTKYVKDRVQDDEKCSDPNCYTCLTEKKKRITSLYPDATYRGGQAMEQYSSSFERRITPLDWALGDSQRKRKAPVTEPVHFGDVTYSFEEAMKRDKVISVTRRRTEEEYLALEAKVKDMLAAVTELKEFTEEKKANLKTVKGLGLGDRYHIFSALKEMIEHCEAVLEENNE